MRFSLCLLLLACDDRTPQQDEDPCIEDAAALFATVPQWTLAWVAWRDAVPFGPEDFAAYEEAAQALSACDTGFIEEGLIRALDQEEREAKASGDVRTLTVQPNVAGNAFVLLRLIFKVPEYLPKADIQVYNPYVGGTLPHGGPVPDPLPMRWPVILDANDALVEIRPFLGGQGHRLLDEFRWFAETFPRR